MGRVGCAVEVAQVVSFVCGPASSYIDGALLDVPGGR